MIGGQHDVIAERSRGQLMNGTAIVGRVVNDWLVLYGSTSGRVLAERSRGKLMIALH